VTTSATSTDEEAWRMNFSARTPACPPRTSAHQHPDVALALFVRLARDRPIDVARELVPAGSGFDWSYAAKAAALDCMLWPIIDSAVRTLIHEDLRRRVRMCSGLGCAWLFLDYSRRRDRKWCDMSVCGNRVKARRFYHANKED
jgi:predicted RNA-binding Zn ribbon-like protein